MRRESGIALQDLPTLERMEIANALADIASEHGIEMLTCCGDYLLGGKIKKAHCTDAALLHRLYSKDLVELLFMHPYTKVQFLVNEGIAKRQTAYAYLKQLESIGVLQSSKVGTENMFLNVRLYQLLSN